MVAIAPEVLAAIVRHARRERPKECCGLLVGRRGRVMWAVAMRNVADSRVRYRIDDAAHIEVRRVLRGFGPPLAIVGVYHSHPAGDASPSETDVLEAMYPDWVQVIVGLKGRTAVRAFRIRNGRVRALRIRKLPRSRR